MPKVSVLTPVYNTDEAHLRACIESILAQTFTDFEFIILNDSPDNPDMARIVSSYNDARIVYAENPRNLGISASRNRLLDMARGQYLAIFDHDDVSLPTRLAREAAYLDENPDVGVVSSFTQWIPQNTVAKYKTDNLMIKHDLMQGCAVAHSAAMIRRSVLVDNGIRWEAAYSPAEDYMLWVRLMDKTMFHTIPDVLLHYRVLDTNTSHRQSDKMADRDAMVKCVAHRLYPYLLSDKVEFISSRRILLFNCIPLLRITRGSNRKVKVYLFGFIPIVLIKLKFRVHN